MLACAALLTACGGKKEKNASQVAAQVNGSEITVHQINFALQQQRAAMTPEQTDLASRRLLERLIDQELAVQKAIDGKLDNDPRVLQTLEAARRDVLAHAYLEKQAESVSTPTAQEVEAYYAAKPALFKDRGVYTFQEFSMPVPPQGAAQVEAILQAAKTPQAFAEALKAASLPFNVRPVTRPAEELPFEMVDKIAAMSEGQALLLPQTGGLQVLALVKRVAAPVSVEQARPAIERFLLADAKRRKVEAEMKALRASATIKYVGNFAEPAASAPTPSTTDATPPSAITAPAPLPLPPAIAASGPTAPASAATGLDAEALSKGVKGLK